MHSAMTGTIYGINSISEGHIFRESCWTSWNVRNSKHTFHQFWYMLFLITDEPNNVFLQKSQRTSHQFQLKVTRYCWHRNKLSCDKYNRHSIMDIANTGNKNLYLTHNVMWSCDMCMHLSRKTAIVYLRLINTHNARVGRRVPLSLV